MYLGPTRHGTDGVREPISQTAPGSEYQDVSSHVNALSVCPLISKTKAGGS